MPGPASLPPPLSHHLCTIGMVQLTAAAVFALTLPGAFIGLAGFRPWEQHEIQLAATRCQALEAQSRLVAGTPESKLRKPSPLNTKSLTPQLSNEHGAKSLVCNRLAQVGWCFLFLRGFPNPWPRVGATSCLPQRSHHLALPPCPQSMPEQAHMPAQARSQGAAPDQALRTGTSLPKQGCSRLCPA